GGWHGWTALAAAAALALLLALARHLWAVRWSLSRDRTSALPLPEGSMGWPFFGETLHWLIQVRPFHSSRRQRYGAVFKTHLLGKPVIRVSGAENVRKILLGEHSLVSAQWPVSTQILLGEHTLLNASTDTHRQRRKVGGGVFSRAALEAYLPRIQRVVSWELQGWCQAPGPIAVYASAKTLTFRIAAQILLGLRLDEKTFQELAQTFEQLMENLFSLPLNIPFSGLRKVQALCMCVLSWNQSSRCRACFNAEAKALCTSSEESAIELIFAAFFTTASASTSMILLLLKHPLVIKKIQQELLSSLERPECYCQPNLTLEKMSRLRYLDCVIKEVLRLLPPVSGGYRTALQTFELNGYQIPKGWSVMYSIRDTHETTSIYQSPPDSFDPERFWTSQEGQEEHKVAGSTRFHYIPFGGGVRNCIGKELAQTILKLLAIELVSTAHWELATVHFPKMQTVPIVHPVDGLQLYFHPLKPGRKSNKANT
uniref:Cytochrome P450 family 26 subfamily C member 1 n=1 Tax=Varanus komodoensis TaxID=61221 RepID=A0A8D2KS96_VARKO